MIFCLSMFYFSCERYDNLDTVDIDGGEWEWVYSLKSNESADTVSTPSTYGHTFKITMAKRNDPKSNFSMRFYMDNELVKTCHFSYVLSTGHYDGPTLISTTHEFFGSGESVQWVVSSNESTTPHLFFTYDNPISPVNGSTTRNYFRRTIE